MLQNGDTLNDGKAFKYTTKHGKRVGDRAWIDHPDTGRRVAATIEGHPARLLLWPGDNVDVVVLCARYGPGEGERIALIDKKGRLLVQPEATYRG